MDKKAAYLIVIIVLVIIVGIAAYLLIGTNNSEPSSKEQATEEPEEIVYKYSGELQDVTNEKIIRDVNTGGAASGSVEVVFEDGVYTLTATFTGLQRSNGSDFYEGWIINESTSELISVGQVAEADDNYTISYNMGEDYSAYTKFVLTIEADDGESAPADHILEGTIKLVE
jgi:uncharacterized protein (UPF0333 family)